ncbi:Nif3-like dinuclear metal center hexameric protein [Ruminococcaceae bacterium OttesenSCG-928-D13]|nr:Nif3-like dinuclear metal center hexameric protein [Ruminococcaceae bacterium OttesenSCG-928-D13]
MKATQLYEKLDAFFKPDECTEFFPKVGLQFEGTPEIDRVYTATFTGDSVFRALRQRDARRCMLFTHHPTPQREFPGGPVRFIPEEDLALLERSQITLFSYHIPLDRNGPYSPGNSLARAIGVTPYGEFYFQDNVYMGVLCRSGVTILQQLADALQAAVGHQVKTYPYGDAALEDGRLAIMAGGASNPDIFKELREKGINCFITGVTNPAADWVAPMHEEARRQGVSLIGGTHYSTEKFALMAMVSYFESLGLPAEFLPEEPLLEDL